MFKDIMENGYKKRSNKKQQNKMLNKLLGSDSHK